MSFLKKSLILFVCFLTSQSLAMNKIPKFKFNKVFNKIASKDKSFKAINKKFSLKKMPKLSFGATYLKSMNWKKYAMLGGLAGYGLWQCNESMASAGSEVKEKSWYELSKKEKDKIAKKYIENPKSLTNENFKTNLATFL
jgi:hypothetical protein